MSERVFDGAGEISDDELARLALAADPDQPVDADAVALTWTDDGLLPAWYMPALGATGLRPVRRLLLGGVVVALVVINAAGLCVTYGFPEIAW